MSKRPGTPTEKGPFRAEHVRSGDPYEISNGHPVRCLPTGGQGAMKTKLGVMAILSDPAATSSGVDPGYAPRPDMLRAPDLAVGNVPDQPGWIEGVPLLAVEFADTGQDEAELKKKTRELLREGTKLVWVVRLTGIPRVEVHEPERPMWIAGLDDELVAPGILKNPVPVRALFDPARAREVNLKNLLEAYGYGGLEDVRAEGKAEGKAEGVAEGIAEGKADALLRILEARGVALTDDDRRRVRGCREESLLDAWLVRAARGASRDDVFG